MAIETKMHVEYLFKGRDERKEREIIEEYTFFLNCHSG